MESHSGPAAASGLKTDDLILTIGGQVVHDTGEFKRIVESLAVGREVAIEIKRKNELLSMKITPAAER